MYKCPDYVQIERFEEGIRVCCAEIISACEKNGIDNTFVMREECGAFWTIYQSDFFEITNAFWIIKNFFFRVVSHNIRYYN